MIYVRIKININEYSDKKYTSLLEYSFFAFIEPVIICMHRRNGNAYKSVIEYDRSRKGTGFYI